MTDDRHCLFQTHAIHASYHCFTLSRVYLSMVANRKYFDDKIILIPLDLLVSLVAHVKIITHLKDSCVTHPYKPLIRSIVV